MVPSGRAAEEVHDAAAAQHFTGQFQVSGLPTASITISAPRPPVSSRTARDRIEPCPQ